MKTWRKLEELVEAGLVRHIGTSNMTIPKLGSCCGTPGSNRLQRNKLHRILKPELFNFVVDNGMIPIGLVRRISGAPGSRRTPSDTAL
jgi:diketogulonate reductase-like aldo/keto reductase